MKRIILASGSERRRELLKKITTNFEIIVPDIDENVDSSLPLEKICVSLALQKAYAVSKVHQGIVIAADTLVGVNGRILGKPKDFYEAENMFRLLCGSTHEVITGVCITDGKKTITDFEKSLVSFKEFDKDVIYNYIGSGQSYDKAGGYGIQDLNDPLVKSIEGDYDNIVGLPVKLVEQMMEEFEWRQ